MNFKWVLPLLLALFVSSANAQDTNAAALVWQVKLPGATTGSSPAIALDGTIYQGTFDGYLLAISPQGKVKWQFKAGREIKSSPAIGTDGTIYFGSRDRNAYALTPAGKLKWKFPTGAWVDSSPALALDGTIYFGSHDKTFYALTPGGQLKWKFPTGGIIAASPAIGADGTIYFGSHDQNFYALQSDGQMKWKFATQGTIDASPTLAADGTIYFRSTDGFLIALARDGSERWRVATGDHSASTAVLDADGNIYLGGKDMLIVHPDGKIFSQHPTEITLEVSMAITANREMICSIPWLRVGSYNLDHPWPPSWAIGLGDNISTSPNVDAQGLIYVANYFGLFAIRPPNPAPPAASTWPLWRGDAQQTGRAPK